MSVIGRPAAADGLERLSLRTSLELAPVLEAVGVLPPGTLRIKWPNDLLARDRKLVGILCEARWHGDRPAWVVVGVGVNLTNQLPPALATRAIRLADLGRAPGPRALAEPVRNAVCRAVERVGPLDPDELSRFAERDWLRGRPVGGPVAGRLHGLGPEGRLRLRKPNGEIVELLEGPTWTDLAGPDGSR
jgi:BirA family biotin operon repressor/biotin-[acetyl-CoA-carboxylase] ligase